MTDIRQAVIEAANAKASPGTPVNLLDIGPGLLANDRFTQDEIVNALYAMQDDGIIRMLGENRIEVLKEK